jgi:hypothetical protein
MGKKVHSLKYYENLHNLTFCNKQITVLYRKDNYIYFESEFGLCKKVKSTFGTKSYDIRSAINKNEFFIKYSDKIHNSKYDYYNTKYLNAKEKVIITCPIHGEFEQTPNKHLCGRGCEECGRINTTNHQKNNATGWSKKAWEKLGLKSIKFDSFKVYVIRCWNENEEFYKIGRTFKKLNKRFNSKTALPYNWEIVETYLGSAEKTYDLETKLKQINKENRYTPLLIFDGSQECYLKTIKFY